MENKTVIVSNKLIEGKFNLSSMEKRVFYLILLELQSKEHKIRNQKTGEYVELIAVLKRDLLLRDLQDTETAVKKAIIKLMSNVVEFEVKEGKPWEALPLLAKASWEKGGNVHVEIRRDLIPHLILLQNKYTIIEIVAMFSFSSKGSQRMHELCCRYRGVGGFSRTLDQFKELFGSSDVYGQFGAFNNRVLKKAHEDMKQLYDEKMSDIYFEYTADKKGTRSVQSINIKVIQRTDKVNKKQIATADKVKLYPIVIKELSMLFQIQRMPKNKVFVQNVDDALLANPDLIPHLYLRMKEMEGKSFEERQKLTRYIINEDCLKKEKS